MNEINQYKKRFYSIPTGQKLPKLNKIRKDILTTQ